MSAPDGNYCDKSNRNLAFAFRTGATRWRLGITVYSPRPACPWRPCPAHRHMLRGVARYQRDLIGFISLPTLTWSGRPTERQDSREASKPRQDQANQAWVQVVQSTLAARDVYNYPDKCKAKSGKRVFSFLHCDFVLPDFTLHMNVLISGIFYLCLSKCVKNVRENIFQCTPCRQTPALIVP